MTRKYIPVVHDKENYAKVKSIDHNNYLSRKYSCIYSFACPVPQRVERSAVQCTCK